MYCVSKVTIKRHSDEKNTNAIQVKNKLYSTQIQKKISKTYFKFRTLFFGYTIIYKIQEIRYMR